MNERLLKYQLSWLVTHVIVGDEADSSRVAGERSTGERIDDEHWQSSTLLVHRVQP